jgi:Fe-S cluster biogenesis protein NfuA
LDLGFRMHAERTPNPNSIKWVLGQPLIEGGGSAQFTERPSAEVSPLAHALFGVEGVEGVFLASNFVTVTKREEMEWTDLAQPIVDALKACLAGGGAALGPAWQQAPPLSGESEVVERILRILDQEIRPAVARDGGDVVFAGFRDGIVELYMQGSCSGCPSSTATLRHGIEARLREAIPEIRGVEAL